METKIGKIINIQKDKGYGFIKPDEKGKKNLFFHARDVLSPQFNELKISEKVEYLEQETPKGMNAVDVAVM